MAFELFERHCFQFSNMATVEAKSTVRRSSRKKKFISSSQEEEQDAGFRFTRQSKRLRKLKEVQEKKTKPDEATKKNTEVKKDQKKRRSSFIRGRKPRLSFELDESEQLAAIKGLHKDIPATLSSNERLLHLFEKSLQLMSERAKNEKDEKLPDFAEKAEEFIADLRTTIRATLSSAEQCQEENQSERIIIPNPKNEQLEVYAKQSEEITKRMLQEDKEWEELLHKYHDENVSSERQPEDANNNEVSVDGLSSEQKEVLSSTLPLDEIKERINGLKLKSFLILTELSKFTETVKAFSDVSEGYISDRFKSLGTMSFEGVTETPRQLIKGALQGNKVDKLE